MDGVVVGLGRIAGLAGMRFAISTSPQHTTWPWLREVWERADQHEVIESGWTFDHFYPLSGSPEGDCLEGWISLTALLAATERLRGGVLVSGMVYRHPAVLANMAATLDVTSGGRLELGIGAGWHEGECAAYGIELGSLGERFDRLDEGLAVVTSLLASERSSFSGRYFELRDAMCNPKPVQHRLPICIGGTGPRRTMPLVARYAQHWNYGSQAASLDEFTRTRDVLARCCEAEARALSDVCISAMVRGGDVPSMIAAALAYGDAGADLAIISVPKTEPPSWIDDLAAALSRL